MKKKLPTGRVRRAFDLARIGARSGAAWATARGNDAAAKKSAEILGNLRGIAAKIGQSASYVDGLIPPGQREVYEAALGKLQRAAPASPPEQVNALLLQEFGKEPEELFVAFEMEPVASASIGQVHRARLHDGSEVAVKIQHTGIEEAVESDLKNIGMLEGLVNFAGPKGLKAGPLFDEVLKRFREELDYRVEARHQMAFRELHKDYSDIHIPEVIAEFSGKRVLTSRWVAGATLDEAAQESPVLRASYARAMWRFVFRGNLVGGAFNADPHPGNYFFHPDGSVTFIDFGCVQPLLNKTRRAAVVAHRAVVEDNDEHFRIAAAQMLGTRGGEFGTAAIAYSRQCFQPLRSPRFHLTAEYATQLFEEVRVMKKSMGAKDGSFVAPPPQLALMNRLQFGFYSVLARLDVEVDYRAVELAFLEEAEATETGVLGLP